MATYSSILAWVRGAPHGQRSLVGYSPWSLQRVRRDLVTKAQPPHFPTPAPDLTFLLPASVTLQ